MVFCLTLEYSWLQTRYQFNIQYKESLKIGELFLFCFFSAIMQSSSWYSSVYFSLPCSVYLYVTSDTALSSAAASTDILIGFHLKALFTHRYLLQ